MSAPLAPLGERGPGGEGRVRGADSTPRGVSLLLHLLIRKGAAPKVRGLSHEAGKPSEEDDVFETQGIEVSTFRNS